MDTNEIIEAAAGMDSSTWAFWVQFAPLGAPFVLLRREDLEAGTVRLTDVLLAGKLFESKSQCHRKMKENAVTVFGQDGSKLAKLTRDRAATPEDFEGGVIVGTKSVRFAVFVN